MIVMEDLSQYEIVDRFLGLNEDHVEMTLNYLAKFHASSMVYHERNGSYDEDYAEGFHTLKSIETYQPYLDECIDNFIEAIKKLANGETFAEKVEKWRGVSFAALCKASMYDETSLNVMNHGDLWGNNMMFLHDENGKPTEVRFVDYQLSFWGSAAHDIYNVMICSWENDIKIKKFDDFIKFYSAQLAENLKLLNYQKKIPTLEDVYKELNKRKFIGKWNKKVYMFIKTFYLSCWNVA